MGNYNLLPCPFCGGEARLEDSYRSFICGKSEKVALVRCLNCGARSSRARLKDYGKTSHSREAVRDAVTYWNTRFIPNVEDQKGTEE